MDILQPLASFLLDTAAKGTVLLVLAGIAVWMLRLSSAAVRHSVWSLTMVSLILLPAASLALPSWGIAFLPAAEDVVPATLDSVAPAPARSVQRNDPAAAPQGNQGSEFVRQHTENSAPSYTDSGQPVALPESTPGMASSSGNALEFLRSDWTALILVLLWGIGTSFFAVTIAVVAWKTVRLCRRCKQVSDGMWCRLIVELKARLQLHRTVQLLEYAKPIVPLACGVFRPFVLLPQQAREWDEPMQRSVLTHELAHVKRWDVAFQLIGRIACTMYWFHPLAWYGLRKLRQEAELACDDAVMQSGEKASDYANQLLRVAQLCCAQQGLSLGVGMAAGNNLERRVTSLFDPARRHGPVRRVVSVALLVACGLVLGVVASVAPVFAVVDATEISDPETVDRQTAAAVGVNLLPEDASEEKPATEQGSEVAKPAANQKRAEDTNRMARNDDSRVPINSVIWWEKVGGLQVGFLLDSPGLPNRRVPFVSVVKYRILVRNTTDKDVTFIARPVPFDYRDAPYLIPAENITNALDSSELPREFRATDGRQGWKNELAYEMTLGGGESAIIPGHNGGNDLGLYVGNGDAKSLPKIAQIRAGMNWIVQPVQVWLSDEFGYGTGALFEGRYFQTKVDREGKTISNPATRMVVDKGGTVLYPRIQLEVGTLNAAAARNAKLATWGNVDKGIQCGIRLISRRVSYEVGDTLEAELFWRNTSDAPINSPLPRRVDLYPKLSDSNGKSLRIDFGARFRIYPISHEFQPGEVRSLGAFRITLVEHGAPSPKSNAEPAHITLKPGVYKLSGSGGVSSPDSGSPTSGKIEFTVVGRHADRSEDIEQKRKAAKARIEALGGKVRRYDDVSVAVDLFQSQATNDELRAIKSLELIALTLTETQVTDEGLVHLKDMKRLGDLGLTGTRITDAGLVHLRDIRRLEYLMLGKTDVTDDGLNHLKSLTSLHMLDLSDTRITDRGLAHVGDLQSLRTLILSRTPVTDRGIAHLSHLTSLHDIRLDRTLITDEGFEHLNTMSELHTLVLNDSRITGTGLGHVPTSVKSLWLAKTGTDDVGLKNIAHLTNLETLILSKTAITDEGLRYLEDLKNLRNLNLDETRVSSAATARLRSILPECQISR